jgi:hypothetical protein
MEILPQNPGMQIAGTEITPANFSNAGPPNTVKGTHLFLKHQYVTVTIRAMAIVRPSGELQCRRLPNLLHLLLRGFLVRGG